MGMNVNPDDYPVTTHLAWGYWRRYFFIGPFTGAIAGIIQFMASITVAGANGDINSQFRGLQGVVVSLILMVLFGAVFGHFTGALLMLFERYSIRRVRPIIVWPYVFVPLFFAMLYAIIYAEEFMDGSWIGCVIFFGPFAFGVLGGILSSAKPLSFLDNR